MKTLWNRLTLMQYATEDNDGKTKWWHYVLAGVVLTALFLAANIGAVVGF